MAALAKISSNLKRLLPLEEVAGLEVTEKAVRLAMLSRERFRLESIAEEPLEAGTILNGEVKNVAGLTRAFAAVKEKAGANFQRHPLAILSLPSAIFYLHILEIPEVPEATYDEAAHLNAIQLSPIKLDDAYFDWQNMGVNVKTLERELLIAVAAKSKIDPYLASARGAKIDVVAVEPTSLGLIRILNYFAVTAEKNLPHLILYLSTDGLNLLVTKDGKPFFDEYIFWRNVPEAADATISREDFEQIVSREVDKLLNFYRAHHEEDVAQALLFSPVLKQELADVLYKRFKLKIVGSRFPTSGGEQLSDLWAGALGSALRGVIPRSADTIVSLMPEGTETIYAQRRLLGFVSLWGKIVVGTLIGLSLIVGGLVALLFGLKNNLAKALLRLEKEPSAVQSRELTEKVAAFNQLVAAAKNAERFSRAFSQDLSPIVEAAAQHSITIRRLSLDTPEPTLHLQGLARTRQGALDFRKALEDSGRYATVDFPLGSVSQSAEGVTFIIVLTLR